MGRWGTLVVNVRACEGPQSGPPHQRQVPCARCQKAHFDEMHPGQGLTSVGLVESNDATLCASNSIDARRPESHEQSDRAPYA